MIVFLKWLKACSYAITDITIGSTKEHRWIKILCRGDYSRFPSIVGRLPINRYVELSWTWNKCFGYNYYPDWWSTLKLMIFSSLYVIKSCVVWRMRPSDIMYYVPGRLFDHSCRHHTLIRRHQEDRRRCRLYMIHHCGTWPFDIGQWNSQRRWSRQDSGTAQRRNKYRRYDTGCLQHSTVWRRCDQCKLDDKCSDNWRPCRYKYRHWDMGVMHSHLS